MKLFDMITVIAAALLFAAGISFLLSFPVYLLWNYCLVGAIDGVREVSWLQAWGLMILSGFLFKTTVERKKD